YMICSLGIPGEETVRGAEIASNVTSQVPRDRIATDRRASMWRREVLEQKTRNRVGESALHQLRKQRIFLRHCNRRRARFEMITLNGAVVEQLVFDQRST